MRLIYLIIGFITGLGYCWGCFTLVADNAFPFLLSIACFSRSSKRFEDWLYHTKLYQTYVADFRETKSITRERKKKSSSLSTSWWEFLFILHLFLPVKIGLGALTIFITYYLFKVIPDKE